MLFKEIVSKLDIYCKLTENYIFFQVFCIVFVPENKNRFCGTGQVSRRPKLRFVSRIRSLLCIST
jgi:hypothetical protein